MLASLLPAGALASEEPDPADTPPDAGTALTEAEPMAGEEPVEMEAPAEEPAVEETPFMEEEAVAAEIPAMEEAIAPEEAEHALDCISASGTCGGNLTWTLDENGLLTISGTGDMWEFSEYYPESAGDESDAGFPMSALAPDEGKYLDYAPWNGRSVAVREVVIESGVTSIGSYAFNDCTSLASVEIPGSITKIRSHAFYNCTSLTSVTFGTGFTRHGYYAFLGCTNLTEMTFLGESVPLMRIW